MGTILIVDDDEDILSLLRELFEEEGWQVRGCSSGAQALREIAACPPDLLLLDLVLPAVDGGAVLAQVRSEPRTARLPVLVMTATTLSEEEVPGVDALIHKPFIVEELVRIAAGLTHSNRPPRPAPAAGPAPQV